MSYYITNLGKYLIQIQCHITSPISWNITSKNNNNSATFQQNPTSNKIQHQ